MNVADLRFLLPVVVGDAMIDGVSPESAMEVQIARYRQMSGAQRLAIALELHEMACDIARAGIRWRHPDASEEDVEQHLRSRLRLALTAP